MTDTQLHLAWCYANGDGVTRDMLEAVKLFRKVADQRDVEIQLHLGKCYANGEECPRTFQKQLNGFAKRLKKVPFQQKLHWKDWKKEVRHLWESEIDYENQ